MSIGKILNIVSYNYDQYIDESSFGSLEDRIKKGDTGGSFGNISDSDYKYLLLFNDDLPIFHELPLRALVHLPSLMTRLGSTQVTYDHYHYWAWCAEVLKELNRDEEYLKKDVEQIFLLTIDYAVGQLMSVPVSKRLWDENEEIRELVSPHAQRAMLGSYRAATQLSHPVLEGVLRRLCSDYVRLDGRIRPGEWILKRNGSKQKGGRANNVGDLLHHYEKQVAEQEIAYALASLRSEIENYSTSNTGFGIINSWRHPHSHGGERFSGPEHVVLLNIVCQLVWGIIPNGEYENIDKSRYTGKILWTDPLSPQFFDYYPLKETRHLLIGRN